MPPGNVLQVTSGFCQLQLGYTGSVVEQALTSMFNFSGGSRLYTKLVVSVYPIACFCCWCVLYALLVAAAFTVLLRVDLVGR